MTSKQLKFMQLFADLVKLTVLEPDNLAKRIKPILALDFKSAVDVWEYMTTLHEAQLSRNRALCEFFGATMTEMYGARAEQKTILTIRKIASIRRFAFTHNPIATTGLPRQMLTDAIRANKLDQAGEYLRCLQKNPHIDFGALLKEIIEMIIADLQKQSAEQGKKLTMSKKLQTLLYSNTAKLKSAERSLLDQRIKEVN